LIRCQRSHWGTIKRKEKSSIPVSEYFIIISPCLAFLTALQSLMATLALYMVHSANGLLFNRQERREVLF